ncbi:MAG: nitronate monooxygenase, partial [Candidatus Dadabacteria bacterium]
MNTIESPNRSAHPRDRVAGFCAKYGLRVPILLAPMAGACPVSLSIAVANAGGMGAMGALLTPPVGIREWVKEFRAGSSGPFQLNVWIPDPKPHRDAEAEARIRAFLASWGPEVPATAGDVAPPDFQAQCEAFIELNPTAVSSIMGLFPP